MRITGTRLLQLAGGDGELHNVGGHESCGIGYGGEFRAASGESFQLPIVQRGSRDGHVISGGAVLAVGAGLDALRAWQFCRLRW